MHQDWTTVRGKKLNNPKNQIFSYKELRSLEPIILVNIDNIITEEFKKIRKFSQERPTLNTHTHTHTHTTSLTYQWGDV